MIYFLVILIVSIIIVAVLAYNSPDGYEDETGFHEVTK